MKIGIIFGGKSCEHDISIITGLSAVAAAAENHTVIPIYINGDGDWLCGKNFDKIDTFKDKKVRGKRVHLRPSSNALFSDSGRKIAVLEAIILCLHGINGEDGSVSGLLNLTGIPYAGSGVLASAAGMDKAVQKRIYRDAGLNVTPFCVLSREQIGEDFFEGVDRLKELNFPLIVKPVSLGSSIGIGIAHDFKELYRRLDEGFLWDNRVIVEEAIEDFIEVNCAVLGYGDRLLVSAIEQPISNDFLTYEDKYLTKPIKGCTGRYLPAQIDEEMAARVSDAAKTVFSLLGCAGVARVDFLIKGDELFVNEINTIPGSLSSYLFAFDGMDFSHLIDKLLEIAMAVEKEKSRLKYAFNSNVLQNLEVGAKK